ncbi:hypothetical protein TrVGV298_011646 [Trichoderma virens]|nr:hypothetical protein TrVGV298_011646 [Trichoderma virens]
MSEQPEKPPLPPRNEFIHKSALAGAIITPPSDAAPSQKGRRPTARAGQSIYGRFGSRVGSIFDTGLPEGAKRTQQLLKEQREREAAQRQAQKQSEPEEGKSRLKDIWMGGEGGGLEREEGRGAQEELSRGQRHERYHL